MFVKKICFQIKDEFEKNKNKICAFMLILLFFPLEFFNTTNYERKVIKYNQKFKHEFEDVCLRI